ncbi:MAG: cation diffusion facilitator family transporter [Lachnospiraceae bacterium]
MEQSQKAKSVYRVSIWSMIINGVLVIIKIFAGIFGHSKALISDAIHSASDVLSTIVVMIGYKISCKREDSSHPYGHERMECVAAVILATMLAITGGLMGYNGIMDIVRKTYLSFSMPGRFTIYAAILSIIVKEVMYWATRHVAKKVNSDAVMADAWHHRSDALSSIGSLIGVLLARNGLPVADPVASIVICLFILKVSYDIYADAFKKMVDHSCDDETVEKIRTEILKEEGAKSVHSIKTRMFGSKIYVDIELYVDGDMTLTAAHKIAENVHDRLENTFTDIKHCMIHVEPAQEAQENNYHISHIAGQESLQNTNQEDSQDNNQNEPENNN